METAFRQAAGQRVGCAPGTAKRSTPGLVVELCGYPDGQQRLYAALVWRALSDCGHGRTAADAQVQAARRTTTGWNLRSMLGRSAHPLERVSGASPGTT